MIVSFYDQQFRGLQNNASLVIDKNSFSLIKRPAELNSVSCKCEAFTEDIQPTFMIIKDDKGRYVYGSLAGIPVLNTNNITEITGTDLKTMLDSDIILQPGTYDYVYFYLQAIYDSWNTQVNQSTIPCELVIDEKVKSIQMSDYVPSTEKTVYNAWEEFQSYLKFYSLYLDTSIDLVNKKVKFFVGRTMLTPIVIRLWEYGVRNYGKWVASLNETQGYYVNEALGTWQEGTKWILTKDNNITSTISKRDIFPVKRKVFTSTESLTDANTKALTELLNYLFNEDLEISTVDIVPTFETKFSIYLKRGGAKYKDLPCGELRYNNSGLYQCQIGYRFTGAEFI